VRRYAGVVAPSTGAGSTTLPVASIYAGSASVGLLLSRIVVKNTTTTAARGTVNRLTSRGTPGAAITEAEFIDADTNNVSEVFNTHTVAPALGAAVASWSVGAAVGASDTIDFSEFDAGPDFEQNERGLYVPPGTANGVGILVIGTGQVLDVLFEFEEQ
jgi:hypothetical protein